MDPIDLLKAQLVRVARDEFQGETWGHITPIRAIKLELQRQYDTSSFTDAELAPATAAISAFRRLERIPDVKSLKHICLGISMEVGAERYRLIEDPRLFPLLLDYVVRQLDSPQKFRRCFQRLLYGYFEYRHAMDERALGRTNWLMLRKFLLDHLDRVRLNQRSSNWVDALTQYRHLLNNNPCLPCAEWILNNYNKFKAMCLILPISERSWVIDEAIVVAIRLSVQQSDEVFKTQIETFVNAIEERPTVKDIGLKYLLTRYIKCANPTDHNQLKSACIARWGNPLRQLNEPIWDRWVEPDVRLVVSRWIKLRCMEDFFSLLQDGQVGDTRRLRFWEKYVDHIHDVYFILGRNANQSSAADYKRARENMHEKLRELGGAQPVLNAFVMFIGQYIFVEFSHKGNACHIFHGESGLKGKLEKTTLHLDRDLKRTVDPGHVKGLVHSINNWESNFAREILKLTGIPWNQVKLHENFKHANVSRSPESHVNYGSLHTIRTQNPTPTAASISTNARFETEAQNLSGNDSREVVRPIASTRRADQSQQMSRYTPSDRNEAVYDKKLPLMKTALQFVGHSLGKWFKITDLNSRYDDIGKNETNGQPESPLSDDILDTLGQLKRKYHFAISDLRGKGGNLWVLALDNNPDLSEELNSLGFTYKPKRGWWRE